MNIFKNKKNYVIARSLKNEVISELGTIKYTLEDAEKLCAGLNKRKQNIAYLFMPFCENQDDYKNVFIESETR